MNKDEMQKVRDALVAADRALLSVRELNEALAILDAALAADPHPAVCMQSNHLTAFISHACGSDSMLARCSDHQLMPDYQPLFTAPVAAPQDATDWEAVSADQAMTIAMLRVDYQQLQTLVTSQGVRMMEQEDWQKDAERYRWLRQAPQSNTQITTDQLWGEELDASIDRDMKKETP